MNIEPSLKMSLFEPAIFGDLKTAAAAKKAAGFKLYDLSLGSPDLPPDERARKAIIRTKLLSTYIRIYTNWY